MSSFRKKIFVSHIILFLMFLVLLYYFAGSTVKRIVYHSMQARAQEIIAKIQSTSSDQDMIALMRTLRPLLFHRLSIINDKHHIVFDSHSQRLMGTKFSQEYIIQDDEVLQAIQKGTGYYVGYSDLLSQKFTYLVSTFNFHGKSYIMHSAFPYRYVEEFVRNFEIGFMIFAIVILLLFTVMTSLLLHHFSTPIQQIINTVTPYSQGKASSLPEIKLSNTSKADDFARLAATLNSLSSKVQDQINSLTYERNEKQTTLESLTEGVLSVDAHMRVCYVNSTALQLLDKTQEELLGQPFSICQYPKYLELLSRCQHEGCMLTDLLKVKRDGQKYYLHVIAVPKQPAGAVLILQDQSNHYRLVEMRKEFISNASHELRTPITIIQGFAEMLQDNPTLPRPTVHSMTGKIVHHCEKMTHLIANLLTLSDVEHIPHSRLLPCDLLSIAHICQSTLLHKYPQAKIQVLHDEDAEIPLITGDPHLLELAINNLLENAIKYSPQPAQIEVRILVQEEFIEVTVSDRGFGIAPEDFERIFDRFYRIDRARSHKIVGSGLGLSLVQTIMEKHFGSVSLSSRLGEGSTFTLLLPMHLETLLPSQIVEKKMSLEESV